MGDKDQKTGMPKRPMRTRRNLLKAGASAAGFAMFGMTGKTLAAAGVEADRSNLDEVQLLFVQNAQGTTIADGQLSLVGVNPSTIFFADRPKRLAGHMSTEDFVIDWQEGTGKESFHSDPPNATLSVFGQDEIADLVVTLKNPRLSGDTLVYEIDILQIDGPIPSGPASLFIDPIGRPLSPTSVAGVHRRRRRRRIRHAVR